MMRFQVRVVGRMVDGRKWDSGEEQVWATHHAHVGMWCPLVLLDRGVQAVGNVRPEL